MSSVSIDAPAPRRNRRFRVLRALLVTTVVVAVAGCIGSLWVVGQTPTGGSPWNVLGFGTFRTIGAVMLNPGQYRPPLDPVAGHGRYRIQVGDRPPDEYTEDSMHRPKGIGVE